MLTHISDALAGNRLVTGLTENRAAGPSAELMGRERRSKGDHHEQFRLPRRGRAARVREVAAEVLAFVWGAAVLSFCVLIMAL
jgi:hypothetical protein